MNAKVIEYLTKHSGAEPDPTKKMRDNGMMKLWTTLVSAGVVAITIWAVKTVAAHESQLAEHTGEIRHLQESVKDLRDDIKSGFSDIKKDIKDLKQ